MTVAVVTDSSAALPPDVAGRGRIAVVPLHVAVDGVSHDEGVDITATELATALRDHRNVTTSRPSPGAFLQVYEDLIARGATGIVSVHLSGQMSATLSSAEIAAAECEVPIEVVDSGAVGMAMGYAVLAAKRTADRGGSVAEVAAAARAQSAAGSIYFYVDSLDSLRRGGRIGKASAFFGSALSIKPLLAFDSGHIEPLERVRTTNRALSRLEALAVQAAGKIDGEVDLAVQHLEALERAESLAERLADSVPNLRRVIVVELGAAVGAHVGPGTLAVVVSPHPSQGSDLDLGD
ncbi:DegV family protein [Calidifontibacter terrae]